ncbi:hypothetical protein BG57_20035 [Caballeronia grimmiae]|uniref:Uncharacterized protein n=1 Tax=Caballeronia grimmiae TaxID=1071679 RepID=A0A069NSR6_9BURK|nr:hypothetical protein BG57_20035 [Caballeronia grimmiae]
MITRRRWRIGEFARRWKRAVAAARRSRRLRMTRTGSAAPLALILVTFRVQASYWRRAHRPERFDVRRGLALHPAQAPAFHRA